MYGSGTDVQWWFPDTDRERSAWADTTSLAIVTPQTFSWQLEPEQNFWTPEVILSYSANGMAELSQKFYHVIRHNVCRGAYQLTKRPVLINNWEATYFDFNEEDIEQIARLKAAKLGIDMMVLDDGWFGKRDSDTSGLGDWEVNEKKLKGGLGALVRKINDMGMKFGIWFEPEMISEDSGVVPGAPGMGNQYPREKAYEKQISVST